MATKFGIVYTPTEFGVNGKKEYVRSCVVGSLKRLGVDCIDLYYQVGRWHHTCRELPGLIRAFSAAILGVQRTSTPCTPWTGAPRATQPHVNGCLMPSRAAVQHPLRCRGSLRQISAFLLAAAASCGPPCHLLPLPCSGCCPQLPSAWHGPALRVHAATLGPLPQCCLPPACSIGLTGAPPWRRRLVS